MRSTLVMGVLNTTPDSFSDGGRLPDAATAITEGRRLAAEGADIIDIGGESTRPGASRVDPEEEARRVLPVITALAADGLAVSVDTTRAEIAERAIAAGATIINDVSGGLADPRMAELVARRGVRWVLTHWRGHSASMDSLARYDDVVADVTAELTTRVAAARSAGVAAEQLIIDPGLGFAKTAEHNWALLGALPTLSGLGFPLLIGASRKRFLGELLGGRAPVERDTASAVLAGLVAAEGVWGVRVHNVAATVDAIAVATAWRRAGANG